MYEFTNRTMKKISIINRATAVIVMVFFSTIVTTAQTKTAEAVAFNLQQAIDYAMTNNTRLQNANLDNEIGKNKVKEVIGMGLPQISASGTLTDMELIQNVFIPANAFNPIAPADVVVPLGFGVQYSSSASITASQLIFSNTFLLGVEAAKTYQQLLQKAGTRTKIETIAAVSKAYYSVLVNEERMSLLNANIDRLKKLSEDTKALNENGIVEKLDVDRITLAYTSLLVEKEKVERLFGLSLVLLKYQMGLDQSAQLTLTDKISSINFQSETTAEKPNYSGRIEYSLAETQKRAAYIQYKSDKLSFLPTLAAFANLGSNTGGIKFDLYNSDKLWKGFAIIGATLNVPIFSGGQKHYKTQQSKLGLTKAENDLKFVQQSIDLDFASATIQLQNATASLETQKKNIELAEEVSKVSKLKYEQGIGSNLEVLNAETSLKEAQTNYFSALYDALIAKVDYQKANGTLVK